MASILETCLEQTWAVCIENIFSEAVATNVCDSIGAFYAPFCEGFFEMLGAGK